MFDWLTQTPWFHLESICSIKSPALIMLQCVGGDGEREKERKREKQRRPQQSIWRKHTEVKRTAFLFCLLFSKCTQRMISCETAVANIQRSEDSCLERFQLESQQQCVSIPHWHDGFYQLHGKWKFKGTLPCVEKRLQGRLTQLPFIASDKRLNHTLHCLKCLLVIRSRILLSLLPLADCSWSKPNDGVSAIGSAGWVNLPIGTAICQGREPC